MGGGQVETMLAISRYRLHTPRLRGDAGEKVRLLFFLVHGGYTDASIGIGSFACRIVEGELVGNSPRPVCEIAKNAVLNRAKFTGHGVVERLRTLACKPVWLIMGVGRPSNQKQWGERSRTADDGKAAVRDGRTGVGLLGDTGLSSPLG
jgi:hypothetical protein